jgi:sigma-B regulation protein RsbU (phosphoserine phosphatase)
MPMADSRKSLKERAMESPRVWIWTEAQGSAIESSLAAAGVSVRRLVADQMPPPEAVPCALAIVDGASDDAAGRRLGPALHYRNPDCSFPILYLATSPGGRRGALTAGADACLVRPFQDEELIAQVRALLHLGETQQRLLAQAAEARHVNRRLQQAHQRIDGELELARRIQQSFLPQSLPELPQVRLAVHYRPCGRVGGDFYDVFRLDEQHLGLYVADAMGHGVPASLLTIFLKKGVRPKEIQGRDYRLLPPDEVLARLNREMIEQRMLENTFITMTYLLLNFHDGTVRFARAGHPLPLHLPAGGTSESWSSPGPILGVCESAFPTKMQKLKPGDKVVLFTDGIDSIRFGDEPPGVPSLSASATRHRDLPVRNFVDAIAADLLRQAELPDDFTLLALEWGE